MRRCTIALAVVMVLIASTASAGMYGSLRYAGTFNLKEFAVGMQGDPLAGEVALGYANVNVNDIDTWGWPDDTKPSATYLAFGAALFYQFSDSKEYGLDLGARFQYLSLSGEIDYEDPLDDVSGSLSGFAFGPVFRGRWYFADGAVAIGPEVYPYFSTLSSKTKVGDDEEDGPGLGIMEIEYSLRMDFYF